jgi:hypothetical protein
VSMTGKMLEPERDEVTGQRCGLDNYGTNFV